MSMKRTYGIILLLTMALTSTAQTEKRDSVELPTGCPPCAWATPKGTKTHWPVLWTR